LSALHAACGIISLWRVNAAAARSPASVAYRGSAPAVALSCGSACLSALSKDAPTAYAPIRSNSPVPFGLLPGIPQLVWLTTRTGAHRGWLCRFDRHCARAVILTGHGVCVSNCRASGLRRRTIPRLSQSRLTTFSSAGTRSPTWRTAARVLLPPRMRPTARSIRARCKMATKERRLSGEACAVSTAGVIVILHQTLIGPGAASNCVRGFRRGGGERSCSAEGPRRTGRCRNRGQSGPLAFPAARRPLS